MLFNVFNKLNADVMRSNKLGSLIHHISSAIDCIQKFISYTTLIKKKNNCIICLILLHCKTFLPPDADLMYSVTSFKDCSLASYCSLSAFIKQKMRSFWSISLWKSARRKKMST